MVEPSTAVCFDMDGVLVDSEHHWARRERETIFPATVDADVDPAAIAGMNVADLYDYLDQEHGTLVSKTAFLARYDAAARDVYREDATLLPRADELVADLRAEQPVVLVSSSPVQWIEHVLDRFDLAFDVVVSAEHVTRGKPAPDVYDLAAAKLGVPPGVCVAVEDSAHGVAAAAAAGMRTVGFSRRGDPPGAADTVASDIEGLRRAVRASESRHR